MNVDVVIVTYNRLEKLKKTLQCYENQTQPFRNLIVVNNHSTDGTTEFLSQWEKTDTSFAKFIITTDENLGGSGGYYLGQKKALELNSDWVFMADDDAYPDLQMMEHFYSFAACHDINGYSAVCAQVNYINGEINYKHRSRVIIRQKRFCDRSDSVAEDYGKEFFLIDFLSYVGPFVNMNALRQVGVVNPKYFIYYDDSEHSLRLKKYGELICVPSILITHDEMPEATNPTPNPISWKDYYFNRNKMHMLIKHYPRVALHQLRITIKHKLQHPQPRNDEEWMQRIAIRDAWLNRLGKHKVYVPGWDVTKR